MNFRALMENASPAVKASWKKALKESYDKPASVRPISSPELEPDRGAALECQAAGKPEGAPRITVRFTGFRCRPLDPDNFAAGCKPLLDGCRYAGLIPGDEEWRIRLETEQRRVRHREEERTEIEIVIP